MDFDWNVIDQELYERLSKLAPTAHGQSWRDRWNQLGSAGVLGLCLGEQHGGSGLQRLSTARMMEALGRSGHDLGLLLSTGAHLFACAVAIEAHGTEQQKAILPRLCSGEWVGASAITEPGAGSDVYALKTRAEPEKKDYLLLDGSKSFVTNAPVADLFVIYAQAAPERGYLGVEAFLVHKSEAPGLVVGPPIEKIGLNSSPTAHLSLNDIRIPASARLGKSGAEVFASSMSWERTCLFGAYVGMMERQLERCISFARDRKQFRKPISRNQAVSHKIADMKARLESSRLLLYRACWLLDRGRPADLEVSLAKSAVSEAAVQSSLDAIQIHGASGVATELEMESMLRDSIPSTIFSGTSEMQREIIARELGL